MTLTVSAPAPAFDVPVGEAALAGVLAHLREVIDVVDLDDLDRLTGDELLVQLGQVAALVRGGEAVLAAMSDEVSVRSDPARGTAGLAARHNYQKASHLIEVITGMSSTTACRFMRVGRSTSRRTTDAGLPLPPLFPEVGRALRSGCLSLESADVITRELTRAAPRTDVDSLALAEETLVGEAVHGGWRGGLPLAADLVAIQARQWYHRLDADGIEPRADRAFQRRDFWVSRTAKEGLIAFGGQVTVDVGTKLHAVFDAVLSPRTSKQFSPIDGEPNDGSAPARDPRSPGQQRADVFAAMIDCLARSGDLPTVTGAAPTVVVTVTADGAAPGIGTGRIVGVNTPVAASTIRQILCDASVIPVFLSPNGSVVALGNEQRSFTRAQRMAMIARDGPTCTMTGCQVPATGCEAHHVIERSAGGPTHIGNGALFCWFHHRMIDTGVFTVEMVDGRPNVTIADWLRRKPYFH